MQSAVLWPVGCGREQERVVLSGYQSSRLKKYNLKYLNGIKSKRFKIYKWNKKQTFQFYDGVWFMFSNNNF